MIKLSDWLTCKDILLKLSFTEGEIEKALFHIEYTVEDLTDKKVFEREPTFYKVYEKIRNRVQGVRKEYMEEYVKEVKFIGSEYRIKAQYQGLKHNKLIFQLFKNRYNWFDSFTEIVSEKSKPNISNWTKLKDIPEQFYNITVKELIEMSEPINIQVIKSLWDIYELRDEKNEIYLKTEFGSLYVPYESLIKKDFTIIESRMKSYALSYHDPINLSGFALNHRGRTIKEYKKDKKIDYENMIKPLKSKEYKQLKQYLQ